MNSPWVKVTWNNCYKQKYYYLQEEEIIFSWGAVECYNKFGYLLVKFFWQLRTSVIEKVNFKNFSVYNIIW